MAHRSDCGAGQRAGTPPGSGGRGSAAVAAWPARADALRQQEPAPAYVGKPGGGSCLPAAGRSGGPDPVGAPAVTALRFVLP
jgi:hypothetical protein